MRNSSKTVGHYHTDHKLNSVYHRTRYHAGKKIMEMLKPSREALRGSYPDPGLEGAARQAKGRRSLSFSSVLLESFYSLAKNVFGQRLCRH